MLTAIPTQHSVGHRADTRNCLASEGTVDGSPEPAGWLLPEAVRLTGSGHTAVEVDTGFRHSPAPGFEPGLPVHSRPQPLPLLHLLALSQGLGAQP